MQFRTATGGNESQKNSNFSIIQSTEKMWIWSPLQMNFRQKVRSTWYSSSPFCQRIFSALREWWWHLGGLWEKKKIVNSFAKVVTLYWWCWVDLTMQHQHSNVVTEISYGLTFSSWIIRLNPISHTGYDVDNKNWILIGIKCKYLYYFAEGMPLCAFTVQLNEF